MIFDNADEAYLAAVLRVLRTGVRKPNRTGVDTLSTFGVHYAIDISKGFPLLTTKEINWSHIVVEMLWFLSGRTDIGVLQRHGIKFWDAWADAVGEVPSAYGNFWRNFPPIGDAHSNPTVDQIAWVIEEIKLNPMSRRLVVNAWHPDNALDSELPPCHLLFVFNVTPSAAGIPQKLNLHLTQRSADMALGVPYNIASYGLLLNLMARFTDLQPGIFSHTLVDAHIYTSKEEGKGFICPSCGPRAAPRAGAPFGAGDKCLCGDLYVESPPSEDHIPNLLIQQKRIPSLAPQLRISGDITTLADVEALIDEPDLATILDKFPLYDYDPHPPLKFKVAV